MSICVRVMVWVALSALVAAPGHATDIEVGVVAGLHEPLDQEDSTNDSILGARVRVPFSQGLKFEIGATRFDMDLGPYRVRNVVQEIQSWTLTGVTAALTIGGQFGHGNIEPFLSVGSGLYFVNKTERPDTKELGVFAATGVNLTLREEISRMWRPSRLGSTLRTVAPAPSWVAISQSTTTSGSTNA